jgi:hypothetical protein
MRLIIAGSRNILPSVENLERIYRWLDEITANTKVDAVLDGGANGVDAIGSMWAYINKVPVEKYPADWSYGKIAGPMRNGKMADNADALALIWDGKSKGSANMLYNAQQRGLKIRQLIIEI